jgi:hypothetical protein
MFISAASRAWSNSFATGEQRHQKQHQKNDEQDFGDGRGGPCDAAQAEKRGNNGDDQEY